jgi:hypothetical protein
VQSILLEEHPLTVIQIFAVFKALIGLDQATFKSLLVHLHDFGRTLFKPQYPLRVIFAQMAQLMMSILKMWIKSTQ